MKLNREQQSLIIGSMLGDGGFSKRYGNSNVYFEKTQCMAYYDYVNYHNEILKDFSKVKTVYSRKIKMVNKKIVHLNEKVPQRKVYTPAMSVFTELENKWYLRDSEGSYIYNTLGHRIKIVPKDISLDSLSLAIWHCDDGCNAQKNRTISFATQSFAEDEIDFLIHILQRDCNLSGYKCKCNTGKYLVNISAKSYLDFIEIVKKHIKWDCMSHKISLDKYSVPNLAKGESHGNAKLTENAVKEIFNLYGKGYNQINIGEILNVDNTTVQFVLKGKTWRHLGIEPIKTRTNNKSGCVGVYFNKLSNKWVAEIIKNKQYIRLGSFLEKEEAVKIRKAAEVTYRI